MQVCKTTGRTREGVQHEVTVYFNNIADRDEVKAAARNRSPADQCGVSNEVPHHLRANYRALQDLTYRLKQKGPLRRNVRYNDETMDLEMAFSLCNKPWKVVLPAKAKAASTGKRNKRRALVSYSDLNSLLAAPDVVERRGRNNDDNNTNDTANNKDDEVYPAFVLMRTLGH